MDGRIQILVILVLDEFNNNLLLGLYLKHLHDETNERGRLAVASKGAAEVVKFHGFVNKRLGCKPEALFFPIGILVDLRADDLLNEVLRIRSMNAFCSWVRPVRHWTNPKLPNGAITRQEPSYGKSILIVRVFMSLSNK